MPFYLYAACQQTGAEGFKIKRNLPGTKDFQRSFKKWIYLFLKAGTKMFPAVLPAKDSLLPSAQILMYTHKRAELC